MTRFDDLDRAIDAYFDLETMAPEPQGLLESVTRDAKTRHPHAAWLARLRQARAIPVGGLGLQPGPRLVLLLAAAALVVAMVGVTLFAGGRPVLPAVVIPPSGAPTAAAPSASVFPIGAGESWIAYMSNIAGVDSDRLHLVRPDGSGRHELATGLEGQQEHPDWSPDGSTIAFERWLSDATYPQHDRLELWTVHPDGSDPARIVDCALPCLQVSAPAWSPDGGEIAFIRYDLVSTDVWGSSSIEVLDLGTGATRVVLQSIDGSTAYYQPRWSPDGSELVFGLETYGDATESVLTRAQLAIVSIRGSAAAVPRIIPTGDMDAWEPDWHPSDDRILFRTRFEPADPASRAVATDIWVVRADGTDLRNVTDLGLADLRAIEPTWTPDGTRIVFTQVDGFGGSQIPAVAFMDADGANAARLGFADGTRGRLRPTH